MGARTGRAGCAGRGRRRVTVHFHIPRSDGLHAAERTVDLRHARARISSSRRISPSHGICVRDCLDPIRASLLRRPIPSPSSRCAHYSPTSEPQGFACAVRATTGISSPRSSTTRALRGRCLTSLESGQILAAIGPEFGRIPISVSSRLGFGRIAAGFRSDRGRNPIGFRRCQAAMGARVGRAEEKSYCAFSYLRDRMARAQWNGR